MTFLRTLARPFTDAYDAWTGTDLLRCSCRAAVERYVPKHRAP